MTLSLPSAVLIGGNGEPVVRRALPPVHSFASTAQLSICLKTALDPDPS